MRARYYSPALKRFMNADIILGSIVDPSTLNLYAYVNGNPISYVDPFGLSREEGTGIEIDWMPTPIDFIGWIPDITEMENLWKLYERYGFNLSRVRGKPYASFVGEIPKGMENVLSNDYLYFLFDELGDLRPLVDPRAAGREAIKLFQDSGLAKAFDALMFVQIAIDAEKSYQEGERINRIISDALVDVGYNLANAYAMAAAGAAVGSVALGPGNLIGAAVGFVGGLGLDFVMTDVKWLGGESVLDKVKDAAGWVSDRIVDLFS